MKHESLKNMTWIAVGEEGREHDEVVAFDKAVNSLESEEVEPFLLSKAKECADKHVWATDNLVVVAGENIKNDTDKNQITGIECVKCQKCGLGVRPSISLSKSYSYKQILKLFNKHFKSHEILY